MQATVDRPQTSPSPGLRSPLAERLAGISLFQYLAEMDDEAPATKPNPAEERFLSVLSRCVASILGSNKQK
jgi:hypothetical protein